MVFDYSILVIGKINAGKTSLINKLSKQFDIPVTSFGSLIKNLVSVEDKNTSRSHWQDFGYHKFVVDGANKLLNDAIDYSGNNHIKKIIFDGVRHVTVLNEIKKISKKTYVIFLNVDEKIRYNRYTRYLEKDITLEEFQKIDNHFIEQGIYPMKQFADIVIDASNMTTENIFDLVEKKISFPSISD